MVNVINFFTSGSSKVGFGHVHRCVNIAQFIKEIRPDLKINFEGVTEASVISRIKSQIDASFADGIDCTVGVYDRMDHPEIPEFYSH